MLIWTRCLLYYLSFSLSFTSSLSLSFSVTTFPRFLRSMIYTCIHKKKNMGTGLSNHIRNNHLTVSITMVQQCREVCMQYSNFCQLEICQSESLKAMTDNILKRTTYRQYFKGWSRSNIFIFIIWINDSLGKQTACHETDAADRRTVCFSHNTSDGQIVAMLLNLEECSIESTAI